MPLPYALPVPRTWQTLQPIKAPYLRADAAQAIALLTAPPVFVGIQSNTQSIPNSADTPVSIDTELYDNAYGHLDTTLPPDYFGILAGWYLCQGSGAVNYTGGAGATTAGIALSVAGGAITTWYGQRVPNPGTSGVRAQAAVAKLIPIVNPGRPSGDYINLILAQNSGAAQNTNIATSRNPELQAQWVAALSGAAPLPVPACPAWPTPPSYVTSAFMNANVRDTINFLLYPPIMEAYYAAGTQSLASQSALPGTGHIIPADTALVDNYGAFSTSTHTWTAPVAGTYWCYAQSHQSMNSTSQALAAGLTITSANYNGGATFTWWGGAQAALSGSGAGNCAIVRRRLRLAAGDTVAAAAFQNDSGAATTTMDFIGGSSVSESRLIIVWRGA